jgi:UDP-glucose-4-epimerase GalE
MSAVLVTGGAGYIGSHASKALAARGESVVIFDNFSQGHRAATGRATVVEGDIEDTAKLVEAIQTHGIDAIMHFAAWLSVGDSVKDPAGYYRNNVVGALSVFDAMIATGVRHLVFSSTCAIFGTPDTTPIHEDLPKRPINAYGETKLAIEHALPHFEHAYGLRSVALRYFNAAGADVDGELGEDHSPEIHVIPRALDAAMGRGSFRIFGDDYPTPDGNC